MKKLLTFATISLALTVSAQNVGIGTSTPDANAILELSSSTKGFLMPRVSDANMNAMPSPFPGMMLFNTNLGRPHVYVGTWKKIMLDGDPFSLPYSGSGNFGSALFAITQASSSSAIFGNNTGGGIGISGNSATGEAIRGTSTSGTGGYFSSTSGRALIGVGDVWLNNTNGKTMIGNLAAPLMQLHISDAADTALLLIDNNTALATGTNVGTYFKNGSFYTGAIKTTGTGTNVARLSFWTFASGSVSGLRERMSIVDNGNVGINNNNPQATLDINGTVKISGGSPGDGKVLTSDATGNASWSDAVGFLAYNSSGTTVNIPGGGGIIFLFNTEQYDQSPNSFGYNTANGTYTAPVSGLYTITTTVAIVPTALNQLVELDLQVLPSGVNYESQGIFSNTVAGKQSLSNTINLSLLAGQSIRMTVTNSSANAISVVTNAPGVTSYPTFFSAVLIK